MKRVAFGAAVIHHPEAVMLRAMAQRAFQIM
jgi:hypothetical protein